MRWLRTFSVVVLSVFASALLSTSHAVLPQTINYQARLTDAGGSPLNTNVNITFTLYTDSAGTTPAGWTETHVSVPVTDGILELEMGSQTGFPAGLFDVPLFLGVEVNSDGEMTPLQKLLPAPYAFQAEVAESVADGAIMGSAIAAGAIGTSQLADDAVTAAKVNSEIITTVTGGNITGGGLTVTDQNLTVAGTGQVVVSDQGVQFSDGSVLTSVGSRTVQVDCTSESLQDTLDALGPGGGVTIEIDGVCNESINVRRGRVEIRGNDGVGDGITGDGSNPAVTVDRPLPVWFADLTINGNGQIGLNAIRNASVVLYNDAGQVVLTGGSYGAFVGQGAQVSMFSTEANGNANGSVLAVDGAGIRLDDVDFEESLDPGPFDVVVDIGRGATGRITGSSTVIRNTFGSSLGYVLEVFHGGHLRIDAAAQIDGIIGVYGNSFASIRNVAALNGAIEVSGNASGDLRGSTLQQLGSFDSYVNVSNNSSFTVRNGSDATINHAEANTLSHLTFRGDMGTLSCTGGAGTCDVSAFTSSILDLEVNFQGDVSANENSQLNLTANLTDDPLDIGRASSLTMDPGAVVTGAVNCNDGCKINGFNGQITGQVNVFNSSQFFFGNGMSSVDGGINVGINSSLTLQNGVAFGTGVTPLWPGGPVINVDRGSDLGIEQDVVITGDVNLSQGSSANVYGTGAEVTGNFGAFNGSIFNVSNGFTLGGDLSIGSGSEANINDTFSPSGDIFLNSNSMMFVQDSATLNLTDDLWLGPNSGLTLFSNATVQRASDNDPAVVAAQFSTIDLSDGATIRGTVSLENMALLTAQANVTFNGDLNSNSGPQTSVTFWSMPAPSIINGHGINCFNGANGILLGEAPTFVGGGGIDSACDHQFTKVLTITSVNGPGTVTSSPGSINCTTGTTGTCSDAFGHNNSVQLTATPDGGSFNSWGGDCAGMAQVDNITLDADKDCSVTFDPP